MALTLVSDPTRTVNGITSNVIAMKSQIPFEFLREDFADQAVSSSPLVGSDYIVVTIDNTELFNQHQSGDIFYLEFADTYITGFYVSTDAFAGVGSIRSYEFAITYTSDTTSNVNAISAFKNYNVAINLLDNSTGDFILTNPVRYTPKQTGELFVDLAGLFFGYQPFDGALDFKITYAESWNGVDQGYVVSNDFLGLPAKKQLLNDGGANMWEYLPNVKNVSDINKITKSASPDNEPILWFDLDVSFPFVVNDYVTVLIPPYKTTAKVTAISNVLGTRWIQLDTPFLGAKEAGASSVLGSVSSVGGKFLTSFNNPKQWRYYKKTFNWIFDDNLVARTGNAAVSLDLNGYDSSGSLIYTDAIEYEYTGFYSYSIDPTVEVSYFELSLSSGGIASEVLTITQELPCRNPIMIEWQNNQGVMEQYVFSFNQSIADTAKEGLIYESPITQTLDLESNVLSRLPLGGSQTIQLLADNLDANTFNALKQIKTSEIVNLFLDVEGNKKISVAVSGDYTSIRETDSSVAEFGLRIKLPTDFDINNAWQ